MPAHAAPELLSLFMIAALGFILKLKGFISADIDKWLAKFVLCIALPCAIIRSLFRVETELDGAFWLRIFAFTGVTYLFMFAFAAVITGLLRVDAVTKRSYLFMAMFNNVGNLAFPVMGALYGDLGLLYATAFTVVFSVLIWTVGLWILRSEKDKFSLRVVFTPPLIAIIAGNIAYFLRIPVPGSVHLSISALGGTLAPFTMLVIGSFLAELRPREILADKQMWVFVASKQLLLPVVFFIAASMLFGDSTIAAICTMMVAMPCAISNAAFMSGRGAGAGFAARVIVLSTIVFMLALPVFVFVLGKFSA
jgi:hypothetical protein